MSVAPRAMLLAAGKGERMRPLTLQCPKPLLEVAGRALIDYHLERLAAVGVQQVVINTCWLSELIQAHCGSGERWGLDICYSPEAEPLETAGGIIQALPLLGDAPFLVINADIWCDFGLSNFLRQTLQPAQGRLVLVANPPHHPLGDFALHGERVLERGASVGNGPFTFAGIGLYDPHFFADYEPGSRPLLPLLLRAIAEQRLLGEHYGGDWIDVGTAERLDDLNRALA